MVMTVNAMGSVFQLVYIILFITYLGKGKKVHCLLYMISDKKLVWRMVPSFILLCKKRCV